MADGLSGETKVFLIRGLGVISMNDLVFPALATGLKWETVLDTSLALGVVASEKSFSISLI